MNGDFDRRLVLNRLLFIRLEPLLREYLLFISFGENAQKNFYVTFFLDIITQNNFFVI